MFGRSGRRKSSRWGWRYRVGVFLLGLVAVHAVVGFLVVPWLVRGPLLNRVDSAFTGEFEVGKVAFNPFTFRFTAEDFRVWETGVEESAVEFERFTVSFRTWGSLFRRAALFDEIVLEGPGLFVDVGADGTVNLARVFELREPADLEEEAGVSIFERLEALAGKYLLRIDHFELASGKVRFRDARVGEGFDFIAEDLRFAIDGFVSDPLASNPYQVVLRGSEGLEMAWEGVFSLFPLRSEAKVRISGLRPGLLQPYVSEIVPVVIRDGVVSVVWDYTFAPLDDSARVAVTELGFEFADLKLALADDPERVFFDLPSLALEGFSADLYTQSAVVERVAIEVGLVALRRDAEGMIDLLGLLPGGSAVDAMGGDAGFGGGSAAMIPERAIAAAFEQLQEAVRSPWTLSLGEFLMNLERVELIDEHRLTEPLGLESVMIRSGGALSNHGREPNRLDFSAVVAGGGALSLQLETPSDFTRATAAWVVDDLELVPFFRLVDLALPFSLESGRQSLSLTVDLTMPETAGGVPGIRGSGGARVDALSVNFAGELEPFAAVEALWLDDVVFGNEPLSLEIGRLRLEGPRADLYRDPEGVIDFVRALERADGARRTDDAEGGERAPELPPVVVKIGRVEVENGSFGFRDDAVGAEVVLGLERISVLTGRLSYPEAVPTEVTVSARSVNGGAIELEGSVTPDLARPLADLSLRLRNLALPPVSAYSVAAIGYPILGGSLMLDTGVTLDGSVLDSHTDITLSRFDLSRDALGPTLGVPVHLGISLLKDREDRIQLSRVPVFGDLAAPDTDIRSLVMQAFVRVIGNLAARPFALLGGILGKSEEALEAVFFEPGRVRLTEESEETLLVLRDALFERPALNLRLVPGMATPGDRSALAEVELLRLLAELSETATNRETSEALRILDWDRPGEGDGVLAMLVLRVFGTDAPAGAPRLDCEGALERLRENIAARVPAAALEDLTEQRVQQVRERFLRGERLDPTRLSIASPPEDTNGETPQIRFVLE